MRWTVFVTLFLALICLFPETASAQSGGNTYYVNATSGNDSNTGLSESQAWKTLTKVNAIQYKPGDTLLFHRGDTWTGSVDISGTGSATARLTIGAYGSGVKPVISALKNVTFTWTQTSATIWKSDIADNVVLLNQKRAVLEKSLDRLDAPYEIYKNEQTGGGGLYIFSPSNPNSYYANSFMAGSGYAAYGSDGSYITVQDIEFVGGKYYGITMDTGGNNIIQRCVVHNPYNSGIQLVNSSNNIVKDNIVSSGNSYGIVAYVKQAGLKTSGNVFTGNTVDHFSYSGLVINGYSGEARTFGNEISNNISYNNGDGVYLHYIQDSVVSGNTLYENTSTESSGEGYGVGIQTGSTVTVEKNNMYGNRTRGIEIWGGVPTTANPGYGPSNGNKILRNYISKSGDYGILLSSDAMVKDTVIAYNAIYDNPGMGLLISNAGNTGTQILNNTFYNNPGNSLFYYQAAKPTVKNNLFANGGSATIYSDSSIGNNGFAGAPLRWDGSSIADSQVVTKNSSFKVGTSDFVNPSQGDFSLKTGSAFINSGQDVGMSTDIKGATLVGLPDIGAFEFGGVASMPSIPPITGAPSVIPSATTKPCPLKNVGDADCSGAVNLADLQIWTENYLAGSYASKADFNSDNKVSLVDLDIWRQRYLSQ